VEDLEQWIAERDVVASSQEMGQDLDHVTVKQNLPTNISTFTTSHTKNALSCTMQDLALYCVVKVISSIF